MIRIEHSYTYPASLADTFAVITDPALYDAVAERSHALEHTTEVTVVHKVHTITLERHLPTDEVPSFARSLVGDALVINETTWWKEGLPGDADADGYHASFDVKIVGKPVTFAGTMTLTPDTDAAPGAGTRQDITGELVATVPFLGGRIESAVKEPIDHQVRTVANLVTERLTGT